MAHSVTAECRNCIVILKAIVSTLITTRRRQRISSAQATEQLERLSLWAGNIGAFHQPTSPSSLVERSHDTDDIFHHVSELLQDLSEASAALLEIVSGKRDGDRASRTDDHENEVSEENELLKEIQACVARLFRVSNLICQTARSDPFDRAFSQFRYHFTDQSDIRLVGERFPKLAAEENQWLRTRLGRAITQRRLYLNYIKGHLDKHQGRGAYDGPSEIHTSKATPYVVNPLDPTRLPEETTSEASSDSPAQVVMSVLRTDRKLHSDKNSLWNTALGSSLNRESASAARQRTPKLSDLRVDSAGYIECRFCSRSLQFENDEVWQRHVLEDLRPYVCTFPDCNTPLFGNIDEWFDHETHYHRVDFKCFVCKDCSFSDKHNSSARERYIVHVKQQHPQLLEADGFDLLLDASQIPAKRIFSNTCPMCSDWGAMAIEAHSHDLGNGSPIAVPVFMDHVATHLEELAMSTLTPSLYDVIKTVAPQAFRLILVSRCIERWKQVMRLARSQGTRRLDPMLPLVQYKNEDEVLSYNDLQTGIKRPLTPSDPATIPRSHDFTPTSGIEHGSEVRSLPTSIQSQNSIEKQSQEVGNYGAKATKPLRRRQPRTIWYCGNCGNGPHNPA